MWQMKSFSALCVCPLYVLLVGASVAGAGAGAGAVDNEFLEMVLCVHALRISLTFCLSH